MLNGKTALITGASRGIGKEIALQLAKLGANIAINSRGNLDEVVKEIEQHGVKVLAVNADVSNFKETEEMIGKVNSHFGGIDIVVNNAGITRDGLIMRMKEEDFDTVIDINLKGTFNVCRQVIPLMMKKRSGKIINISSVVGVTGNAGQCNYAASKAGIIGLTKSLAKECASRNITVNAIAPGFIDTDMTSVLNDGIKDNILSNIPLKKFGTVSDVASTVAFLASEGANYITGQVINVDGGMVM